MDKVERSRKLEPRATHGAVVEEAKAKKTPFSLAKSPRSPRRAELNQ
jgi:hypothetical protein